ncbi:Protein tyrosine kinase [Rhizoctonia solani]|uniref:Protein tyrosine kinase n=1 Tax=Rhizoctonia solani TaxID=456999 RepID=A0A8H7ID00_9AGAM|nr:Protein tyrosine kinase [Rhizoctonia solani]
MPVATVPPFQFPQPTIPNNINQVPEPIETQNLPGDPPSYDAVAGSPSTVSQTSPVLPSFSSQDASAALTVSRSLMTAVNNKADPDEIRRLVLEVIRLAKDENMARRLVDAGVIPHLTIELKNSLPNGQGINNIIFALGLLSHDLLSAASISDDIAAKFIEEGLSELLISWITVSDDRNTQRYCAWTLGTLARNRCSRRPADSARSEDLAVALFAVGRTMVQALKTTIDPKSSTGQLGPSGVTCPNSSDMARVLLRAGAAEGLARLPTVVQAEETDALGSFAFAIARFSCAEWSPGTRKQLVEAGVVDALLRALRAAASVPATDPQVHAELALAISFLGDVGGSSIRKEIQDSGGLTS